MFVERTGCPACGAASFKTLYRCGFAEGPLGAYLRNYYRRPIPEGTYQLDECQDCGLVFQRFVGTDAFLTELYSEWLSQGIDAVYNSSLANPAASRDGHELTTLAAYLGKPRLKVLDYGAGWGLWPIIAGRLGHDAFAAELAPEKAKWMAANGVTVLADEDVARHMFDVINLEQTLEHLIEPREVLRSLLPANGGVVKISVPNAARARLMVAEFERDDFTNLPVLLPFEHVNAFSARSLGKLATSLGLREVRPNLRQRYAFVPGGLPHRVKRLAKDLIRPLWTFNNRRNLYRWFVSHVPISP